MLYSGDKDDSDGRFFVGIASTKIYCLPVCRAKMHF
ncbi:Ada metal-binding domain-containing protein [Extibacter sp. GGCC_0201]